MVKHNYVAWDISAHGFSDSLSNLEKLKYFAQYAILAPSGHNTQPWRFRVDGQSLVLSADSSRHLNYSGTKAAEPQVSLGTCLEVLNLAARGFGYSLDNNINLDDGIKITITIGGKVTPDNSLLQAIVDRVSNRHFFKTTPLDKKLLDLIGKSNFEDVTSSLVSDREDISFVARQTYVATKRIMSDKQLRLELSGWVRNNLTKQYHGMPGHTQGIPTPPSLIAKHVVKNINVSKSQAKKDSNRVLNSANLIIIGVTKRTDMALINAGRLYSQICVLAQKNHISTSGVGAAVIDPLTRKHIQKKFNIPSIPLAIIRLGKTNKTAKHTPRLPLEKVLS